MVSNFVPSATISGKKPQPAWLLLLNHRSGRVNNGNLEQQLTHRLQQRGIPYEVLHVEDGIEEKLAEALHRLQPQRVVAAGGDGTLNLAAKHLHGKNIELAVIPTGSANGMARELQIPLDMDEAVTVALGNTVRKIDVLCLNGQHFCLHLADIGLNAVVVKRFEEQSSRGMWGYVTQFARELWGTHTTAFTFKTAGGQPFRAKAHMVIIANASRYGTGAVVNPDAKLDDGRFELCIIKRMPLRGMIRLAFSIWLGNVKRHPWSSVQSFEEITIINHGHRLVQTDGEVLGEIPEIHIKVFRQALNVVVP